MVYGERRISANSGVSMLGQNVLEVTNIKCRNELLVGIGHAENHRGCNVDEKFESLNQVSYVRR